MCELGSPALSLQPPKEEAVGMVAWVLEGGTVATVAGASGSSPGPSRQPGVC